MILDHPLIDSFYKENPHLDPVKINLKIIELLRFNSDVSSDNSSIINDLLNTVKIQSKNIEQLSNDVKLQHNSIQNTYQSTIDNLISTIKNDYTSDVKNLISSHEHSSITNFQSILDRFNSNLIDKISLTLYENLPKTSHLDNILSSLKNDIRDIFNNYNLSDSDKISNIIDSKYNVLTSKIHDSIFQYLNSHDDKIIGQISQSITIQNKLSNDITDLLYKQKTSVHKGSIGENKLFTIINDAFPNAELIDSSGQTSKGDMILNRLNKSPILIETKDYSHNVRFSEVEKFLFDINKNNICGVFLSQSSGIVNKNDLQIDIHGDLVVVYIHSCNYNIDKIKMAIHTIDHIREKLTLFQTNDSITLTSDVINNINIDFQSFITNRNTLLTTIKDFYKKSIDQLNNITLPSLELFLSTHFANSNTQTFSCDICNSFNADNLRSLARHKTSCKKKNSDTSSN